MSLFSDLFSRVSGLPRPYTWQSQLYAAMLAGEWPDGVSVPTGAGKTSVMYLWLLALAAGARVPRRLVWVVDRRVVVDQATDEAVAIAERVRGVEELPEFVRAVTVSTLRGERADNGEWSEDPTRAAIIAGTVDMVGSRLLFCGYGDGKWKRPQHAGLLGTDALVVNDESHLTPAFARLLHEVRMLRPPEANFRVMLLSATPQAGVSRWPASLDEDLRTNEEFSRRFHARKELRLDESKAGVDDDIVKRACGDDGYGPRRLVFVQSPERAAKIARAIGKKASSDRVLLLTGTMRGFERDQLTRTALFREFRERDGSERCWMVATSAAEVGIDITSDLLITELDTADHLVQRFGRLNRFGGEQGTAIVVFRPPSVKEPRKQASLQYLRSLPDVTCKTMFEEPPPAEAKEEPAVLARFERRLIDLWSMTSVSSAAKPPVAPWLHGMQEDHAETEVAWRDDVELLTRDGIREDDLREVLRRHRVLAHEKCKEPVDRLEKKLSALPRETRGILVAADGSIVVDRIERLKESLPYSLLLLPSGVCRLDHGMICGMDEGEPAQDVADVAGERRRERYFKRGDAVLRIGAGTDEQGEVPRGWMLQVPAHGAGDGAEPEGTLYYWTERAAVNAGTVKVPLDAHLDAVAGEAARIAREAGLDRETTEALVQAARLHDCGKERDIWQDAAGRMPGEPPLAKPVKAMRPVELGGYRHELGSLLDARDLELPEAVRELILHLIAAHHGWARPHLPPRAADKKQVTRSREECVEVTRRFGRLQARYGAWGLAYLEALLRAADARVSVAECAVEQPENA